MYNRNLMMDQKYEDRSYHFLKKYQSKKSDPVLYKSRSLQTGLVKPKMVELIDFLYNRIKIRFKFETNSKPNKIRTRSYTNQTRVVIYIATCLLI